MCANLHSITQGITAMNAQPVRTQKCTVQTVIENLIGNHQINRTQQKYEITKPQVWTAEQIATSEYKEQ